MTRRTLDNPHRSLRYSGLDRTAAPFSPKLFPRNQPTRLPNRPDHTNLLPRRRLTPSCPAALVLRFAHLGRQGAPSSLDEQLRHYPGSPEPPRSDATLPKLTGLFAGLTSNLLADGASKTEMDGCSSCAWSASYAPTTSAPRPQVFISGAGTTTESSDKISWWCIHFPYTANTEATVAAAKVTHALYENLSLESSIIKGLRTRVNVAMG